MSLPYDPKKLKRELKQFYISMTDQQITEILNCLGLNTVEELFSNIPADILIDEIPFLGQHLDYRALQTHVENLAKKNKTKISFIGDGLPHYKTPNELSEIGRIRGLLTAYTAYQPERSQGTLASLYLYSCAISMLTGFEAINSSMYDRASCLFEAFNCALKIVRKSNTVLLSDAIYPGDHEVLNTLKKECNINIELIPTDPKSGLTDLVQAQKLIEKYKGQIAAIAFAQINTFGNLEDVHALTNLAHNNKLQAIAIIDPILLAAGGLETPINFGERGADMIVGEGQHLASGPNFGGPGLGIFGIRYNDKNKISIRNTAGRFVGKGIDEFGKEALTMVLSTREQHIRREKASSNICSNQAFIATIAGAGILLRGEKGMEDACAAGFNNARIVLEQVLKLEGVELAFPNTPFFNEITLKLNKKLISQEIHAGVEVQTRLPASKEQLQKLSFSDIHSTDDLHKLIELFRSQFGKDAKESHYPQIDKKYLRQDNPGLPNFDHKEVINYYQKLGEQNVSPDDVIYPLGSCTMKYNPHINEYAASLPGFQQCHPQAPLEDCQGSLEILFETQEIFKKMTGLAAVTTQPVAGANGELTGLKMFQAYHRDRGEAEQRNIVLIPHSAHGTNPATATMAGFETKKIDGIQYGIVLLDANEKGQIDIEKFKNIIDQYNDRISGIMVTNPNTSGILETEFKHISELVHNVGGLVYMDGANLNAIAGWVDLAKMGVDAVHSNLHKTFSTPHGGGGPGGAIVAVSNTLVEFLPGIQVIKKDEKYTTCQMKKSIGSVHRHFGNFGVTTRCYTYLKALGTDGIRKMSAIAVLSARYLYHQLKDTFPTLPAGTENVPRMHEFILTISPQDFERIAAAGTSKANAIPKIGKLFLDYGLHAPTVAFPEIYGLMIEPTETFDKDELDRFVDVVKAMATLIRETPQVLATTPHFTPVAKVDEVSANKALKLMEPITKIPKVISNNISVHQLAGLSVKELTNKIVEAHNGR